jgi:hypothetical protein
MVLSRSAHYEYNKMNIGKSKYKICTQRAIKTMLPYRSILPLTIPG